MVTADNGGGNAGRLLLRSVRVDNYKCLGNFELPFGAMTLLLGKNGCGKTAVFDAVYALHQYACRGKLTSELFPSSTLMRWGNNEEQTFELRVGEEGGGEFRYRLTVHRPEDGEGEAHAKSETLTLNDEYLYKMTDMQVQLYNDDHSEGGWFFTDPRMSCLDTAHRNKNSHLGRFYDWLRGVALLSLEPKRMKAISASESKEGCLLDAGGDNFASWYRWTVRKDDSVMAEANTVLGRVLSGYRCLKLAEAGGDARELRAIFKSENGVQQEYAFSELSLGQRALIALYCFMHGGDRNRLLLLDEPDNFVTLPEVQPLLMELDIGAGDELPQIAMISHHPEAVSFISDKETVWMAREPEQPARVVEFKNDTKIRTAKLYARGLAP